MSAHAAILGSATHVTRRFEQSLEFVVHATVLRALADAGLESLGAIDTVVTAASDTLDGIMVATRSEIAGSFGHSYLHVPSSAGHALAAAVTMIEAGTAQNLLLVGWGEGSKFIEEDSRVIQADPFFTRPVGAIPAALAALQAQFLIGAGLITEADADAYAKATAARVWPGRPPATGAGPVWLRTGWCDGVVALVLAPTAEHPSSVRVRDFATSFRPYTPDSCADIASGLDPAAWVVQALPAQAGPFELIEASAPTPICEARAGMALSGRRFNASGGGAAASFGIATGFAGLAAAATALRAGQQGCVIDLAGPIGQAVTVIALDRSGAP